VSKVVLPNIRKLFIPDPGYIILDADLKGADALVVAKECNDSALMEAAKGTFDLHSENATVILAMEGIDYAKSPKRAEFRQQFKSAIHGTNYVASARTLALTFGWPIRRAENFQSYWFRNHPGVRDWHKRTEGELFRSRTASNKFGYRIIYFDRIDGLLPEALAWIPQSTVAESCFRGALQLEECCPYVEILIQVHDSLVFQIPKSYYHEDRLREIHSALHVPVPYPDPLVIPWKLSASEKSWGDCQEIDLKLKAA
jgi:DNA polymerase I